ncbi:MAG TPA: PilX N-terminal domain-containing pilus assembly protein [Tahibacter sp.]|uniref:pilus assembly PilX family protein n=1 Tax=Tahibacter sp. TaxID=2056211 RepID=UPI002C6F02CE|nr:PilX N-terminal domain-containing pilus assembly protein [Tahibacter sp.]HSX60401.1 PilX N-terminal domain-containing pilus assembly protein [Tahibacter sp.]
MKTFVRSNSFPVPQRQRGAVLFIALMFLILLTLLGLASSGSALLQERMTGGVRNRQLALLGTESAARFGEAMLWNAPSTANLSRGGMAFPTCLGDGVTQPCVWNQAGSAIHTGARAPVTTFRTAKTWVTTGSMEYTPPLSGLTGSVETASIAVQPRLLFEDLGLDTGGFGGAGRMGGSNEQEQGGTTNPSRHVYRVTSRSQGGSGDSAIRVTEVVYSAFSTDGSFSGR